MPFRSRSRKPKSPLHHNPVALRQAREAAGIKQATLAGAIGRSPGFLSELESGQRGASPETLTRLAKALNIDVAQLERRKSHRCPDCAHRFDLPASGLIPLHQIPATGQWCTRGNTAMEADAAVGDAA
ncbi:helix-turn-helix transcriptional regulator [Micromonospora sp. NPDC005652]|uniref:helix-turn-helix domain-containing protein n=1 Tax=Micromonospora sp. NPDC005652 TaxID=3157046 RepID=UPI0033FF8B92